MILMETSPAPDPATAFRNLPSVDDLLRTDSARALLPETGPQRLTRLARAVLGRLRESIQHRIGDAGQREKELSRESLLAEAERALMAEWQAERRTSQQRVINATGVVIHTNLGRAPLSENARRAIADEAAGYCALEYDLETGKRGKRGRRAEQLLVELTGAESALIVNNCAAAAFMVLTVLASPGEVVISRGELVEIGGDFRVPDVLAQSGAVLREVGTTNRTKLSDYELAINENSRMIMRVHPSNYRIVGFTESPAISDLADLAHAKGLLLYEDAGSGALADLAAFGLGDEPVIGRSINAGVDILTFSGDKLLGGPQAGLIVGRSEIVDRLRKHPLYRVLRADKLTYAAMQETLETHIRGNALEEIPVLRMLSMTKERIAERAAVLAGGLRERLGENSDLHFEVVDGVSAVGGGSAPAVHPATVLLAIRHASVPASRIEQHLRMSEPPVIARILDDAVVIDLRTVSENEEDELLGSLLNAAV